MRLDQAVVSYLAGIRGGGPHLEQAKISLNRLVRWLESPPQPRHRVVTELQDLTQQDLLEFIAWRRQNKGRKTANLSTFTVNKDVRYLRLLLAYVDSDRVTFALPSDWVRPKIKKVKEPKLRPRSLSEPQLERLFDSCQHARRPRLPQVEAPSWWRALYYLAFVTSMRRRALFNVPRPTDEDLAQSIIRLPAEFDKAGTERVYPMTPALCETIRKLPAKPGEPMFVWDADFRSLYREMERMQEAAGIPKAGQSRLHDLRRSTAVHMLRGGAPVKTVQEQLGHSTSEILMKHYVEFETDQQRQAVNRLMVPKAVTQEHQPKLFD